MTMSLEASGPNAEQIRYWNETAGSKWVAMQAFIDEQIRPLGLLAMERGRIAAGDHVLDVGCGCGDSTHEIARRVGATGSVTAIDLSEPMLARARETAHAAGLANATFLHADAAAEPLPAGRFGVLYSRFGVMFFADPPAGFANLRRSIADGGRLAFVCWRGIQENPWMLVPLMAAAQHFTLPPPPPPGTPGPFAFADSERVAGILAAAGFADIAFEPVDETLTIGGAQPLERTVEFLLQMGPTGRALREVGADLRETIAAAVLEAVRPHQTAEGLRMASAAWIVTARAG
jgi:SAM-dependent methyltransferase